MPVLTITIGATIGMLAVGMITYQKNPKSSTNRLLLLFTIMLSLYSFINLAADNAATDAQIFFWVKQIMSIAVIVNYVFFLLASTFPKNNLGVSPRLHLLAGSSTIVLIILAQLNHIFSSITITPTGTDSTVGIGMPLFLLQTFSFLGIGFFKLRSNYIRATGNEKSQYKFFMVGTIIMFLAILITNLLFVIIFNNSNFVNLLPIYTFIFVSFIAYAIVRHKFLDITFIVFRAVSYTLLTLIIIGIYASFLLTIPSFASGKYREPLTIALGILLVYTFNPLKRIIENITQNIFYKQPYSSEDLLERLGEINRSTIELKPLTDKVLQELLNTIHITWGSFIIDSHDDHGKSNEDHAHFTKTTGLGHALQLSSNTIHNLKNITKDKIVVFEDLEEGPEKMLLRHHNISLVIPLSVKGSHHGIIVLGPKSSGEIFSNQDLGVMEIFMPQISIAIQNALSFEEISRFNITLKEEVRAATSKLRDSNKELKKLDKLKDDFIYIATHELKNPVTAMKGYISLIKDGVYGKVPPKMSGPMDQIASSSQELIVLINDLLQIARIEADSVSLHPETFDICSLTDVITSGLKPLAEQKSLKLIHHCPTKSPTVYADQNKVREVIHNLISNAIKYTDSGSITTNHEIIKSMLITHVTDTGVGISKKDQEKLFSRFYRVEKEAAKGIPGTGLGLYITKQLIEKMGGEIWLDSTVGKGTTFSFSLPIKKPN